MTLIPTSEVLKITNLTRRSVYERLGRGHFPKPEVSGVGGQESLYREADILAWMTARHQVDNRLEWAPLYNSPYVRD